MKLRVLLLINLGLLASLNISAQDSIQPKTKVITYTIAYNKVPDQYNIPLFGFINRAEGSHNSTQIGFINWNQNNFTGFQAGLVNNVGGDFLGAQFGAINNVNSSFNGAQISFINNTNRSLTGTQISFLNKSGDFLCGAQLGFINSTDVYMKGAQIGFANRTKTLKGIQLGFMNYCDTISRGVPIGFLSIVREGGYESIDLSLNELYPVNVAFNIGVKKLYSTFIISYNPDLEKKFAIGFGVGSIISLGMRVYYNPELVSQRTYFNNNRQLMSLTENLGYSVTKRFDIIAGPSILWQRAESGTVSNDLLFSIFKDNINYTNLLSVGFRISLRYNLGKIIRQKSDQG